MSIRYLPRMLAKQLKPRTKSAATQPSSAADQCPQLSPKMQQIHAERARITGLLDDAARDGVVPDAHALSLHASNVAELAEVRQQLGEVEAAYVVSLRRLDAMFPEPPSPMPEPPAPKSPQTYPRLGELLGERGQKSPLH
jgi:hypothetical protein